MCLGENLTNLSVDAMCLLLAAIIILIGIGYDGIMASHAAPFHYFFYGDVSPTGMARWPWSWRRWRRNGEQSEHAHPRLILEPADCTAGRTPPHRLQGVLVQLADEERASERARRKIPLHFGAVSFVRSLALGRSVGLPPPLARPPLGRQGSSRALHLRCGGWLYLVGGRQLNGARAHS